MKILIWGNGVMSNIVKNSVIDDEVVAMVDSLKEIPEIKDFDIIIDFSHHSATKKMLDFAMKNNKPVLIATTGHNIDEIEYIKECSKKIAILKTSNTSLGIKVMRELVKMATKLLEDFDIEVLEKHHNRKIDAPSGTAKTLIEEVQKIRNLKLVESRTNKRESNEITVHSLRAGTIAGEHSVIYAGLDEIIEIKHTALSRKIFAVGAIKMAKKLLEKEKGYYEDLIF